MIEEFVKLDDLYKKNPFIYEINEDYYYIGHGICQWCASHDALDWFKLYREALDRIGRDKISSRSSDIVEEDLSVLVRYYRKVMAYSASNVEESERHTYRNQIDKLIASFSEIQKSELLRQMKDYENVFYYHRRRL